MSLFRKSLHEAHAEADKLGKRAINVFHTIADDLVTAAMQHTEVADAAHAQIEDLSVLRAAADKAASEKLDQAAALRNLVS